MMGGEERRVDGPARLPEGAYFDDEDRLRGADGEYLPDGVYITEDGDVLVYEGMFLSGNFDLTEG